MITLSLCMIVKNEEAVLRRCLSCVRGIFDEIIIADTGSSDGTKHIAAEFTDKIFDFNWEDDFSQARNFSFGKATMDYIMWLDADDVLLPNDAAKLLKLKSDFPVEADAIMMKYNTAADEFGNVTFSFYRERLVKRSNGFIWKEPVHEYLEIWGNSVNSDICVTHAKPREKANPDRNLRIYERLLKEGKKLTQRGVYYYARELNDNGRYADAAKWFNIFLDSGKGWSEDNICSCLELADCLIKEGKPDEALLALFRSFSYDTPRAEACCQIGYFFKRRGNYKLAVFWFETAQRLEMPRDKWGFVRVDAWGFIPCVELAACYCKLGDFEKAEYFNKKAAAYKPESPSVLSIANVSDC